MTDPKRKAAVAALEHTDLSVVLHPIAGETRFWSLFLDAMLIDPQPFLAVLLRVDAVAAALRGTWHDATSDADMTYWQAHARLVIAALTETAAEPAHLEPTDAE